MKKIIANNMGDLTIKIIYEGADGGNEDVDGGNEDVDGGNEGFTTLLTNDEVLEGISFDQGSLVFKTFNYQRDEEGSIIYVDEVPQIQDEVVLNPIEG